MLRLVIDWASDKLASAFFWIKEMASSFGYGLWRSDIAKNDEVSSDSPTAPHFSANRTGTHCEKRQPKNELEVHTEYTKRWPLKHGTEIICYPMVRRPYGGRGEFHFPGHAKVILVPFVKMSPNSMRFPQFDIPAESNTYAKVVKAPPRCTGLLNPGVNKLYSKLFREMRFWKTNHGIFSAFIQLDQSDECAGDLNAENLCPTTMKIVKEVQGKITELFGEALSVEETIVFQNGERTRTIYVAPSLDETQKNQRSNLNEDEIEKDSPKQESEQNVKNCVPEKCTNEEDNYLVLEDKLMRRQDYKRKREQGKANRRRLRQPATSVPVTKREVALMETKSEPISMKSSRKRNNRKGRAGEVEHHRRKLEEEFSAENSGLKFWGLKLDEYDFEEKKPSKRENSLKLISADPSRGKKFFK